MRQKVFPQAALVDVVLAAHRARMVRYSSFHCSVRNSMFQFLKTFSAVVCEMGEGWFDSVIGGIWMCGSRTVVAVVVVVVEVGGKKVR